MAINLQKGQTINLEKSQYDLSQVTIGLGWDVRKKKQGFFSALTGNSENEDYDLDAIAFLIDENEKVRNIGNDKLQGGDVIFFNNLKHPTGNIWLTGDNRTGAGEGDDEQIIVKLNAMDFSIKKILFIVAIYQGKQKNQNFGMIENAFIRAVDAKGKEMAKFNLSGDSTFSNVCSLVFAEVYRKGEDWKFRALGEPQQTDSFLDILKKYHK